MSTSSSGYGAINAKWPGRLLDAGFIPVSRLFLRNHTRLGLEPEYTIFLINLLDYKWGDLPAFPSYKKLAVDLNIEVSYVAHVVKQLIERGFIEKVTVGEKGEGFEFKGLYEKLEKLLDSKDVWIEPKKKQKKRHWKKADDKPF